MEEFDALVEKAILEKFLTLENIDQLLEPLRQRQDQFSKDLKQRIVIREEEALAAKRSLDNLISLVKAGLEDPQDEDFQVHHREAKEIHKQKQRELAQVAAELSPESKGNACQHRQIRSHTSHCDRRWFDRRKAELPPVNHRQHRSRRRFDTNKGAARPN